MALVFAFDTMCFVNSAEPENLANPIRGHAVAVWAKSRLADYLDSSSDIDFEDWDWYFDVVARGQSYMLGFCINEGSLGAAEEVMVQIHKNRTMFEKLSGKNKLSSADPLSLAVRTEITKEFGEALEQDETS